MPWVDVKFEDIKVGDEVKAVGKGTVHCGRRIVKEVRSDSFLLERPGGHTHRWGDPLRMYQWLRWEDETSKTESSGSWVEVEFRNIKVGDKFRATNKGHTYEECIAQSITSTGGIECAWADTGVRCGIASGVADKYERWEETAAATDYSTLENTFGPKTEDTWKPKEIPDYPESCTHCGAPAYIGLHDVVCTGKCGGTQREY